MSGALIWSLVRQNSTGGKRLSYLTSSTTPHGFASRKISSVSLPLAAFSGILARSLGRSPAELHFWYAPLGKPSLASDCAADSLRFNLSHSGSIYAVARHREIGIDLERIEPRLTEDDIPEKFFSQNEVTKLCSLPSSARLQAFFNCWTSDLCRK
jgi:phosphopantetheinyl transferase